MNLLFPPLLSQQNRGGNSGHQKFVGNLFTQVPHLSQEPNQHPYLLQIGTLIFLSIVSAAYLKPGCRPRGFYYLHKTPRRLPYTRSRCSDNLLLELARLQVRSCFHNSIPAHTQFQLSSTLAFEFNRLSEAGAYLQYSKPAQSSAQLAKVMLS
jgi:hypothetical protein